MGNYWTWVCDDLKECFEPDSLLGPSFEGSGKGYSPKASGLPNSSWVVGVLATGRWQGHAIRLVGDFDDVPEYEEVSQYVLREGLVHAPIEALKFLYEEAFGRTRVEVDLADGWGSRALHVKFLRGLAAEDWPRRCCDEKCAHYGERHAGECALNSGD